MAQILVRELPSRVVARLKKRAKCNGRSLQSEVKMILEDAARTDVGEAWRIADQIRAQFKGRKFPNSADLIREDRAR